ncbi:putative glutamate carboxypeptidase LAMP1 [Drosera capensis]
MVTKTIVSSSSNSSSPMAKTLLTSTFLFIPLISLTFFLLPSSPPPKPISTTLFLSLSAPSNTTIASHLRTLTLKPHMAGTQPNSAAASYVLSTLSSYSIPSHITPFHVLLTYPISHSLTLKNNNGSVFVFSLRQEIYDGDENPFAGDVSLTFHAYGHSGNSVGEGVYVNYGRVEDYVRLRELGVEVKGRIAVARYGRIFRGDIVNNAEEAGAVGVVVFSDRKDYGGGKEGRWFPEEKWLPPSGVQVGSVYDGVGDPTTPGWGSVEGCERVAYEDVEESGHVPGIVSLPVSWADGEVILKAIEGTVADDDWQGSEDAPVYRVGPGPGILNLTYNGNKTISKIENVIGVIEGAEEPDRYVILGNHRDAWTFGAVDPNSGTASLLEVARRLGEMLKKGWRPRRSILLCNWDAEEYGLIGSTEWVEQNRELLASRVVAYLNVDCAVSGPGFHVSATPQLDVLLRQASREIPDPDNSSQTLYEAWAGSDVDPVVGRLGGGGSDFSAFVQHVGIPSTDISFGEGYPVYHSMYDDFIWMKNFGDPLFQRHVAVASIWGVVALRLADEEILPFDYVTYATELEKSAKELENETSVLGINLTPLYKSIEKLKDAAIETNYQKTALLESKGRGSGSKDGAWRARELNDRLMMTERAFADQDGLPERRWNKHLIYAPAKHDDYGSKAFPGVDDAIEKAKSLNTVKSKEAVQHEVWRVSRAITSASLVLNGQLT